MRTMYKLAAVAALALAVQSTATAQVQFYNGDPNAVDGYSSEVNSVLSGGFTSFLFENYTVTGGGMTVTGLFGNYISQDPTPVWTMASWEIRSGVSAGNGGTLLFSGSGSASQVGTGQFWSGTEIFTAAVSGLNYFLPAGEYWFALSPHRAEASQIYLATTSGAGAINGNLDNAAFHHMPIIGINYASVDGTNFSLGVEGRLGESTVPEPATMTLLATGLAGLAGARRRKRTNA